MTAPRDAPRRTCVGCRAVRPQTELVRCTLAPDGRIRPGRHEPGRGAWLCGVGCLDRARPGFERAWRTQIAPERIAELRRDLGAPDHLTPNDAAAGGDRPRSLRD